MTEQSVVYIPTEEEISEAEELDKIGKEEKSKKISEALKGKDNHQLGRHRSEETKRKMREAKQGKYLGEKNPFYGKQHTEETKKELSEQKLGKKGHPAWNKDIPISEKTKKKIKEKLNQIEVKEKMRNAKLGGVPWNKGKHMGPSWNKGIPRTENEKRKMSEANKGKPTWNKGKMHTEETKMKMREAKALQKYHTSKLEKMVRDECLRLELNPSLQPKGIKEIDLGKYKGHCYDIKFESKKTVIEVQGCFWHCCPICKIEPTTEQQKKDMVRDQIIREAFSKQVEWKLIELWAHDITSDMSIEYLLRQKASWLFE